MGVSTVTISIEEFEDLISCKRKIEKITELKDQNIKEIKETNKLALAKMIIGDTTSYKRIMDTQELKNIDYIGNILEVLRE